MSDSYVCKVRLKNQMTRTSILFFLSIYHCTYFTSASRVLIKPPYHSYITSNYHNYFDGRSEVRRRARGVLEQNRRYRALQRALCDSIRESFRLSMLKCSSLWPIEQERARPNRPRVENRRPYGFRDLRERRDEVDELRQEILRGLRSRVEAFDSLAQLELAEARKQGESLLKYVGPKGTTLHFRADEKASEVDETDAPEPLEDYSLLTHTD